MGQSHNGLALCRCPKTCCTERGPGLDSSNDTQIVLATSLASGERPPRDEMLWPPEDETESSKHGDVHDNVISPRHDLDLDCESTCCCDSASMLNDLDLLLSNDWQRIPDPFANAMDTEMCRQVETLSDPDVYNLTLRALWSNCPFAMEAGLNRLEKCDLTEQQARDCQYMRNKLEFTMLRLKFVALCCRYRSDSNKEALESGVKLIDERCSRLIADQPDEQYSQLPGLVTKRDTIMLLSRVRLISSRLMFLN